MTDTSSAGPSMVPLAQVAPHPASFRKTLTDLDELARSVAAGVGEPLVVMPADRVAVAWPEHAEKLAGYAWVVLWGHRRLAAARQAFAGDSDARVPVLVRRDGVCDDARLQLDQMTVNALAHRSWNPIEEARALQAMVAAGRTQVEVADLVGCHQSHVSGRLALMRLPGEIAGAVEAGQLGVADARKLARLDDHDQIPVWRLYRNRREDAWITSIDQAIGVHVDWAAYQERLQAALSQAHAEGLRVIDPLEEFGRDLARHRLTAAQVEPARAAGTLVVGVSGEGELEYYTTDPSTPVSRPADPSPDERRAAAAARERAGRVLAARPPALPATAAQLVDAFLRTSPQEWKPIARRWLRGLHLGPAIRVECARWWEHIYGADWETRVWAAHCLTLAESEHRARTHHEWDQRDLAWLRWLVAEAGYRPRAWERRRLAAADTDADTRAETTDTGDAEWQIQHPDRQRELATATTTEPLVVHTTSP